MKFCAPFVVVLLVASAAFAQTPTASVVGRVTDASGAVLPGVTVIITNPDTNRSSEAVTNGNGDYTDPVPEPGALRAGSQPRGLPHLQAERVHPRGGADAAARHQDGTGRAHRDGERHRGGAHAQHRDGDARRRHDEGRDCRTAAGRPVVRQPGVPDRQRDAEDRRRRRGVRRQRRAGRQCRIPPRRHEQHAAAQHQRPDEPVGRRGPGIQDDDLRLLGRVRPLCRRDAERGHQERHEQVPRLGVRVHARRCPRREGVLRSREAGHAPPPVRRHGRRPAS